MENLFNFVIMMVIFSLECIIYTIIFKTIGTAFHIWLGVPLMTGSVAFLLGISYEGYLILSRISGAIQNPPRKSDDNSKPPTASALFKGMNNEKQE